MACAFLAASQYATADEHLTPALLTTGEQSLQNLIQIPNWRGDAELLILCGARLAADRQRQINGRTTRTITVSYLEPDPADIFFVTLAAARVHIRPE